MVSACKQTPKNNHPAEFAYGFDDNPTHSQLFPLDATPNALAGAFCCNTEREFGRNETNIFWFFFKFVKLKKFD